jgi:hypothetical protein
MLKPGSVATLPRNRHQTLIGVGLVHRPLGGLRDVAFSIRILGFDDTRIG